MLVETDAGQGYLKALGNGEGHHALASELVGTQLAKLFGLPTFEFAIIEVTKDDELWLDEGGRQLAEPGPAFISRKEIGETWSGDVRQLRKIVNQGDVIRLVVFDTWVRNRDRFSLWDEGEIPRSRARYDNVFLNTDAPQGKLRLMAMDHTHCFSNGGELTKSLRHLATIKDERVYGLFPVFRSFIDKYEESLNGMIDQLKSVDRETVGNIVNSIPKEWDVTKAVSDALTEMILGRANYVADTIKEKLWPQRDFGQSE